MSVHRSTSLSTGVNSYLGCCSTYQLNKGHKTYLRFACFIEWLTFHLTASRSRSELTALHLLGASMVSSPHNSNVNIHHRLAFITVHDIIVQTPQYFNIKQSMEQHLNCTKNSGGNIGFQRLKSVLKTHLHTYKKKSPGVSH